MLQALHESFYMHLFFLQANAAGAGASYLPFVSLIAIFVLFYVLMIRPQQQQQKLHQQKVAAAEKGDTVLTAGGIYGKVTKVEEKKVEVEIAAGVRVMILKSTLSDVESRKAAKAAND